MNGVTSGPFTRAELEAKAAAGELTADTFVWQEGMAEWLAAGQVEAVAALLDPAPVPVPDQPAGFDPATFLAGTWIARGSEMNIPGVGPGTIQGQWVFNQNQFTFQGQVNVTAQGIPMVITMQASGTFTLNALSPTSFVMLPQGQVTSSVPGMAPVTEPFADPVSFVVIDDNTIRDSDNVTLQRAG